MQIQYPRNIKHFFFLEENVNGFSFNQNYLCNALG
jgi:hypothetical protein